MKKRLLLIACSAVALLMGLPAATAGAATDPVTQLRSGVYCETQANPGGFEISWDLADLTDVDRVIIERDVSSRYWWRGRTTADVTSFSDSVAPRWTGKAEYRIVARSASGAELGRADCDLAPTAGLLCTVTKIDDGYRIDIDHEAQPANAGSDLDYVVRRTVDLGGTSYWRGRTSTSSLDDRSPHRTGVTYQVWARAESRIVGGANCVNDLADQACYTPIDPGELSALVHEPVVDYDGDLIDQINALVPGQQLYYVQVFADLRFVYTRNNAGLSDLYAYDHADQSNRLVAAGIGDVEDVWGFYLDTAGGVYVHMDIEDGFAYRYYGPEGLVLPLGSSTRMTDVLLPFGDRDDGRTVLARQTYPLTGQTHAALFSRVVILDPATGAFEALTELDGQTMHGVTIDGDLLISKPRASGNDYFVFDSACIED